MNLEIHTTMNNPYLANIGQNQSFNRILMYVAVNE